MSDEIKMATPSDYDDAWEIVTEDSKGPNGVATADHWLELRHYGRGLANGFRAEESIDVHFSLKWDGCCHFHYGQGEDQDYLHVCGGVRAIDEVIRILREARDMAIEHYRDNPKADPGSWDVEPKG